MIIEALGFIAAIVVFWIIGIGPSLWLVTRDARRITYAAAIAPTVGLALLGMIGFPMLRLVGPAQIWALPLTPVLAGLSLALVFWDWRRRREDYRSYRGWLTLVGTAAILLVFYLLLALPLLVRGIDYTAFRGNPSDAFTYMSVAETFRSTDWQLLEAGSDISDLPGAAALAEASPTALFTARFIRNPIRLGTQVPFAWISALFGLAIERFYYAFNLLSFALAMPLVLALAGMLRLPKTVQWLGALVIAFGFWARYLLEKDASARTTLVVLFLFLAFAWIQFEKASLRAISRERVLLSFAGAALTIYYVQAVPIAVMAVLIYYALGLLQRSITWKALLYHLITLGVALLIVLLSAQADFALKTLVRQTPMVVGNTSALHNLDALLYLYLDGPAAIWGLPFSVIHELVGFGPEFVWRILGYGIGGLLTLIFLYLAIVAIRKPTQIAQRILVALITAGFITTIVMYATGTVWASGRAFTYVFPFLVILLLSVWQQAGLRQTHVIKQAAALTVSVWFVVAFIVGIYMPYGDLEPTNLFEEGVNNKPENYDVSPVIDVLAEVQPDNLLVNVPRTDYWMFPFYLAFAFNDYPVYYQSGLVADNNTNYQNLWLEELHTAPDFAIVAPVVDYIGVMDLGELLVETEDLRLYRITQPDLEVFNEQEERLRALESDKLPFPGLNAADD